MNEVIVIGAGPAGGSAAISLALRGRDVLIFDKDPFPRDKLCAGGLPPKVIGVLPCPIEDVIERKVRTLQFQFAQEHPIEIHFQRPIIHMVQRAKLDQRLLEQAHAAGATTRVGVKVRHIEIESPGVRVETDVGTFRAQALIACDGANGLGARLLGRKGVRMCPTLAADLHVEDAQLRRFESTLGCDFGVIKGGIGWSFPKRDFLSLGVLSFRPPVDLHGAFRRLIDAYQLCPTNKIQLRSHPLPVWDGRTCFSVGPVLVAGDAAGLVNPLTGAGIRRASISGQLAAESIHAYLCGGGKSLLDLQSYNRRVNTHLVAELRRARILARIFYQAPGWFHRLGVMNARINPWIEELLAGQKSYLEVFQEAITARLHF